MLKLTFGLGGIGNIHIGSLMEDRGKSVVDDAATSRGVKRPHVGGECSGFAHLRNDIWSRFAGIMDAPRHTPDEAGKLKFVVVPSRTDIPTVDIDMTPSMLAARATLETLHVLVVLQQDKVPYGHVANALADMCTAISRRISSIKSYGVREYLVGFYAARDVEALLRVGRPSRRSVIVCVRRWRGNGIINRTARTEYIFWIIIKGFPLYCQFNTGLRSLVSKFGTLLEVDPENLDGTRINYLRVRISCDRPQDIPHRLIARTGHEKHHISIFLEEPCPLFCGGPSNPSIREGIHLPGIERNLGVLGEPDIHAAELVDQRACPVDVGLHKVTSGTELEEHSAEARPAEQVIPADVDLAIASQACSGAAQATLPAEVQENISPAILNTANERAPTGCRHTAHESLRSMLADMFAEFSDGLVKKLANENARITDAPLAGGKLIALANECVAASLTKIEKDGEGGIPAVDLPRPPSVVSVRKQRTATHRLRKSQRFATRCRKLSSLCDHFNDRNDEEGTTQESAR